MSLAITCVSMFGSVLNPRVDGALRCISQILRCKDRKERCGIPAAAMLIGFFWLAVFCEAEYVVAKLSMACTQQCALYIVAYYYYNNYYSLLLFHWLMQLGRDSLKWLQSSNLFFMFRNSCLASTTAGNGEHSRDDSWAPFLSKAITCHFSRRRTGRSVGWPTGRRQLVPWEVLESRHGYIGTWSFSVLPCKAELPYVLHISPNFCRDLRLKRLHACLHETIGPLLSACVLVSCGSASLFAGCAVLLMLAWHCLLCKVLALRLGRSQLLGKRWSDTRLIMLGCRADRRIQLLQYVHVFENTSERSAQVKNRFPLMRAWVFF